MPIYNWEAVTKEGARKSGQMEARNRREVIDELEQRRFLPVKIAQQEAAKKRRFFRREKKVASLDRIMLCRHFSVMIEAGIAMEPALDILIADAEKPALRQFLKDAQDTIRRGQPLWTAFAAHGASFPGYLVGLIRAGETSGNLADAFAQGAEQLDREYKSKKQALAAMVYPAILFVMSVFLVLFLFLFAIPRLAEAFAAFTGDLPVFSRLVFATGLFFQDNVILVLVSTALFFTGLITVVFSRTGRRVLAALAWHIPPVRKFLKKFAIARFSRTLGALLGAGLPLLEAIEITADSVGLDQMKLVIMSAKERIRKGAAVTDAFRAYPEYFPHLLIGMMAIGEQTGQLSSLLLSVSEFFEEDASRSLQTLVALVEPLLLLIMGGIVGAVAVSIIIPIYQSVTTIQ